MHGVHLKSQHLGDKGWSMQVQGQPGVHSQSGASQVYTASLGPARATQRDSVSKTGREKYREWRGQEWKRGRKGRDGREEEGEGKKNNGERGREGREGGRCEKAMQRLSKLQCPITAMAQCSVPAQQGSVPTNREAQLQLEAMVTAGTAVSVIISQGCRSPT